MNASLLVFSLVHFCLGSFFIQYKSSLAWLGLGLIFFAFSVLVNSFPMVSKRIFSRLSRNKIFRFLNQDGPKEFVCLGIILFLTWLILPRIFGGDRIISRDHTAHFFQSWDLQKSILSHGSLWGWSHSWFAGYPTSYFYPFGGYLLILAVRILSLGTLTLSAAYCLVFGFTFFLNGYAVYTLGKKAFNRTVGLIAALLLMTDMGGPDTGGWIWMVFFGVWPISLSMAFSLFAMCQFEKIFSREYGKAIARFGVLSGLALLCHPIAAVHFLLFLPLGWLAYHFLGKTPCPARTSFCRIFLASLIGCLIGSLWLLPFLSVVEYCYSWGNSWFALPEMLTRILKADLFPGMIPAVSVLGSGGVLALLFSRKPLPLMTGVFALLYLFISSSSFAKSLPHNFLGVYLGSIEFQRFSMYIKIFWFIGAAYLIWRALSFPLFLTKFRGPGFLKSAAKFWPKRGALSVKFFLAGILIWLILKPVFENVRYQSSYPAQMYLSQRADQPARERIAAWINAEKRKHPGFFRVGISRSLGDNNNHSYLDLGVLLDAPVFKMDYTPANFYKYKVASDDPFVLKAVNVKYVLSDKPLDAGQFSLVKQDGGLSVYQFKQWEPSFFSVTDAKAEVELKEFGDERMSFFVKPGACGRLLVHTPPFPRWKATFNGKPITINHIVLNQEKNLAFMSVDLRPGAGCYEFIFCRSWVEAAAWFFFLLGTLFAAFVFFAPHYLDCPLSAPRVFTEGYLQCRRIFQKINALFLLLLFFECLIFFYLFTQRRMIGGNDAFQLFSLQYYFLNNYANYGEIPRWIPFLTHGSVATWWYTIQGMFLGLLPKAVFLTGDIFAQANFLPVFYAGLFIDELVLLAGVWLLARRFYLSPLTIFFVTASVMGSCIWLNSIAWNLYLFAGLPLTLYFIHSFLDTRKWRYLFFAVNLYCIQAIGSHAYFIPVTSGVIVVYVLACLFLDWQKALELVRRLKWGRNFFFAMLFSMASGFLTFILLSQGLDPQIIDYNPGRGTDSAVSLTMFMTYGVDTPWAKWLEIVLRVSPFFDYTLYSGLLFLLFIVFGIFWGFKKVNAGIFITAGIVALFSLGTFVSEFAYHFWPLMKFFRHLTLCLPILKLFLIFIAGFGFEAVIIRSEQALRQESRRAMYLLIIALWSGLAIFIAVLANDPGYTAKVVQNMIGGQLPRMNEVFEIDFLRSRLSQTAVLAFSYCLLFFALPFIRRVRNRNLLIALLLVVHCVDIYGYRIQESRLRSFALNDSQYQSLRLERWQYSPRREESFWNNRTKESVLQALIQKGQPVTTYWVMSAFLGNDVFDNDFRTERWLRPFDQYVRAFEGQPTHDLGNPPLGRQGWSLRLPAQSPAMKKISGVTQDKIQFFTHAYFFKDEEYLARKMQDPSYSGDILFLTQPAGNLHPGSAASEWILQDDPAQNQRLELGYDVTRFDANHLEVIVRNERKQPVWMMYSDVWHPGWQARVNGHNVPIFKADLAYKAVLLNPGENKVHFYFQSKLLDSLQFLAGLNSLLWAGFLFWLMARILYPQPRSPD